MDGNMGIRTITKIEANPALFSRTADNRKLKVAAYCRVSTDEEDQLNSLETQMKYYTGKISEKSEQRPILGYGGFNAFVSISILFEI